jgi:hypothetical protein
MSVSPPALGPVRQESLAPTPSLCAGPGDGIDASAVSAPARLLRVAAAIIAATLVIAAAVALGFGSEARHTLHFGFAGVPPRFGEALSIFLSNSKLAATCWSAALVAQLRWLATSEDRAEVLALAVRGLSFVCDGVLCAAAFLNLLMVGGGLAVYRFRLLPAILPHGPFELAGFCVAVSFYLHARRNRVADLRTWVVPAMWTLALLGIAAGLETYLALV